MGSSEAQCCYRCNTESFFSTRSLVFSLTKFWLIAQNVVSTFSVQCVCKLRGRKAKAHATNKSTIRSQKQSQLTKLRTLVAEFALPRKQSVMDSILVVC